MSGLGDTIARLNAAARRAGIDDRASDALSPFEAFGSNPGALGAFVHLPPDLPAGAPLVVVLHGCGQSASGYDFASGWSRLADEQGFALLYPEQRRGNNLNGCFNWFEPADASRDAGEALSIRQMIETLRHEKAIDPRRIFITGLSAGGAMTSTMLAAYPEVFAGGAVIAGLPHGVTSGMMQAFGRMGGQGLPDAATLVAAVRAASDHDGPWPRLSVWHGGADKTVDVANAAAIGAQWRSLHGLSDHPDVIDLIDGVPHRVWNGGDGKALVEEYLVSAMGHGTPLKTKGEGAYGSSAPYMLDVGISSTRRIAQFWGLCDDVAADGDRPQPRPTETATLRARLEPRRLHGTRNEMEPKRNAAAGIGKVIEDALRAAGLMK